MATPVRCPQQREDGFTCFRAYQWPKRDYLRQLVTEPDHFMCASVCALRLPAFATPLTIYGLTTRCLRVRIHPPPPAFALAGYGSASQLRPINPNTAIPRSAGEGCGTDRNAGLALPLPVLRLLESRR